jgi:anti-sigma factor RsiW
MTEPSTTTEDEIIATLSDYLDGTLPEARHGEVEAKLASDAEWQRVHDELRETRDALSGLQKARAPASFTDDVTGTIHKRSAGRFFGRRTLGDRVPFGALLAAALVVLLVLAYVMWSSPTGSLAIEPKREPPATEGTEQMPRP